MSIRIKLTGKKGVDYNAYIEDYFADFVMDGFPIFLGGDGQYDGKQIVLLGEIEPKPADTKALILDGEDFFYYFTGHTVSGNGAQRAPPPRLITWRATVAPWARATSSVPSREPSSTTSTAVATRRPRPGSGRAPRRRCRPRCRRGPARRSGRGSAPGSRRRGTAPRRAPRAPPRARCDPRALAERAQDEQEEDEDREDRDADDPGAVLALERERHEQRVGDLGAGDDRQPEGDQRAGSARRRCAARAGARSRSRRSAGEHQATGADRGQLGAGRDPRAAACTEVPFCTLARS